MLCISHWRNMRVMVFASVPESVPCHAVISWWRHQMETFFALLASCAGNTPVSGEFPTQRPVSRGFDIFFDLRLNKRLSKQSWGWWFETLSCSSWRHCNMYSNIRGRALFTVNFHFIVRKSYNRLYPIVANVISKTGSLSKWILRNTAAHTNSIFGLHRKTSQLNYTESWQ